MHLNYFDRFLMVLFLCTCTRWSVSRCGLVRDLIVILERSSACCLVLWHPIGAAFSHIPLRSWRRCAVVAVLPAI